MTVSSGRDQPTRICHVLNTVGPSAPDSLREVQALTLASIEYALGNLPDSVAVEVRAAHFSEDPIPAPWIVDAVRLDRSVLDFGVFSVPRRLPLLGDVLDAAETDTDLTIFTNIDIAVQPLFYAAITDLHGRGFDAFTVNRRTLHPPARMPGLAGLSTMLGVAHPGTDCFVFESQLLERIDVGHLCLGAPLVGRILLQNLVLHAEAFREFADLHMTYHLGDDRLWDDDRYLEYEIHNEEAYTEVMSRLADRCGQDTVGRLPGVDTWRNEHERHGGTPEAIVRERRNARLTRQRSGEQQDTQPFGRRRLVFAASPGRSGTEHLARLFGTAKRTVAHHEATPTMTGMWLRRIAYEDPARSYDERSMKCDALRLELEHVPDGGLYVDTSHMFIKSFADVVVDSFDHRQITILVPRRPLVQLAASMLSLGWFSSLAPAWPDWLLPPTCPESRFPISPDEVTGRLDLIIGYVMDSELRTRELRERTPDIDWIDLDVNRIGEETIVRGLFERLLTGPTDATWAVTSRSANVKVVEKRQRQAGIPAAQVEQGIASFRDRFTEQIDDFGLAWMFVHPPLESGVGLER